MKTIFTPRQIANFKRYKRVQDSGQYNMLDPQAIKAAGITRAEYGFVFGHYDALVEAEKLAPKHVQAELRAAPDGTSILSDHGAPVASVSLFIASEEVRAATAKRLVACWNACEGVPTDALQGIEVKHALRIGDDWKAERDCLLTTMQALCAKLPEPGSRAYPDYFAKKELDEARATITTTTPKL